MPGFSEIVDLILKAGPFIIAVLSGIFLFVVGRKNGALNEQNKAKENVIKLHESEAQYQKMAISRLEKSKHASDIVKTKLVEKLKNVDPGALNDIDTNLLYEDPDAFLDNLSADSRTMEKTPAE